MNETIIQHETISGSTIPVRIASPEVRWLLREAAVARSWAELEQRTAHGALTAAKERSPDQWAADAVYLLQKDLVGQTGILKKELRGENTPSFGALHLSLVCDELSSRFALLSLIAAAKTEGRPISDSELQLCIFALKLADRDPFGYVFDSAASRSVFSERLADEFDAIKDAGLVAINSPIAPTEAGWSQLQELERMFPAVQSAVRILAQHLTVPSAESLFQRIRAENFRALL